MRVKINRILTEKLRGKFLSDTQSISMNGRRYDAITGKLLKDPEINKPATANTKSHHPIKHTGQGKVVDGFFRVATDNLSPKKAIDHHVAPHVNRATQHSKTLMRKAVQNPNIDKIKAHQETTKRHINHLVTKGVAATAPAREKIIQGADVIKQSEFVGKINELTTPANPILPDPDQLQTTANSEVHLKKLNQLSEIESKTEIDDIFTEAALNIEDPKAYKKPQKDPIYEWAAEKLGLTVRAFAIISVIIFIFVITGATYYFFANNISIFIADRETGIHAILPSYKAPGFSINSINYIKNQSAGSITISYKTKNDSKSYTIIESPTTWDNQALLTTVVEPGVGNSYTTYQVNGRTMYQYGPKTVWISSNIYYSLTNNGGLTSRQIGQIVGTT